MRISVVALALLLAAACGCIVAVTAIGGGRNAPRPGGAHAHTTTLDSGHSHAELLDYVESSVPFTAPVAVSERTASGEWLSKRTLSNVIGSDEIHTVHLPVYLNVFVIGLPGANVSTHELREWLEHLDHNVIQQFVDTRPHAEAGASGGGGGGGSKSGGGPKVKPNPATIRASGSTSDTHEVHTSDEVYSPHDASQASTRHGNGAVVIKRGRPATIVYRYHFRLIETSERVSEVVERHLHTHHRRVTLDAAPPATPATGADGKPVPVTTPPSDPHHAEATYQIDADEVSALLQNLVTDLGLDRAYNMFVIVPHRAADSGSKYGYRAALSNSEIDALFGEAKYAKQLGLLKVTPTPNPTLEPKSEPIASKAEAMRNTVSSAIFNRFAIKASTNFSTISHSDFTGESDDWASAQLAIPFAPGPLTLEQYLMDHTTHATGTVKVAGDSPLNEIAHNDFAQEDCLVDNWVGQERLAFLDLSAGPFKWGPVIGGEGVRTEQTFPRVDMLTHLFSVELGVDTLDGTPVDPNTGLAVQPEGGSGADGTPNWEIIEAERMVLDDMITQHCPSVARGEVDESELGLDENEDEELDEEVNEDGVLPPATCIRYRRRLLEIEEMEENRGRPGGAAATGDKPRKGAAFEESHSFSFFTDGEGAHGHHTGLQRTHFLAHLSATLSNSLSHVFTPALSLLPPEQEFGFLNTATASDSSAAAPHLTGHATTKFGYSETVTFHLYVLSNHQSYDPLEHSFLERLKSAILQLQLKHQTFSFVVHQLKMDDDPTLSMAFTTALRSTVVPSLRLNGHFSAIKRLYLDSQTLSAELSRIDTEMDNRARAAEPAGPEPLRADTLARDIPIFIFSLDYPLPVFVDKHYQSKPVIDSFSSMVVAVQSNHHLWESHLSCNNKPIYWNLRDPVRSIVSSVGNVLAGLLPAHVTHLPPHTRPAQEWSWAVGTSPLTHTSSGLTFSAVHRDTAHRSYIVTAIRRVTAQLNTAINRLRHYHTTPNNYALARQKSLLRPLRLTANALGAMCDELELPESLHPKKRVIPVQSELAGGHTGKPGADPSEHPVTEELPEDWIDDGAVPRTTTKTITKLTRHLGDDVVPTDVRVLQILYHAIRARINGLWHDVGDLEYESATAKLPALLTVSNQFSRAVDLFFKSAAALECVAADPTAAAAADDAEEEDDAAAENRSPNPDTTSAAGDAPVREGGVASIYWVVTLIASLAIGLARWFGRKPAKPHIN